MPNYFLAGVMTADLFAGDQLFSSAKTLLDSSISIGVSAEDVRGGAGGKLFGKYFHTSTFDMNFTDSMFKLEYIAKNIGSDITMGGDALTNEQVTLGIGGTGVVKGIPIDFSDYGKIGWATKPDGSNWQKVTFTDKNFTFIGGSEGDVVCVKYIKNENAARKLVVSSNIIPDTVRVIGKVGLFAGDSSNPSASTRVGNVQIEIPRFLLNGTQEISMTSTGVSNTPLSGSALSVDNVSCDGDGYYAIITEILDNTNWYDDVDKLAISGGSVDLVVGETEKLDIWAVHQNALPSKAVVPDLTFESEDEGTATINNEGLVEAISLGVTYVTVSITDKPTAQASVQVNVASI